jgi:hypothetical protein
MRRRFCFHCDNGSTGGCTGGRRGTDYRCGSFFRSIRIHEDRYYR